MNAFDTGCASHADRLIRNRHESRVRHGRVCPVCSHDKWCLADEYAALCRRVSQGAVREYGEYGYLHILRPDMPVAQLRATKPEKKLTDSELEAKWSPVVRRLWRNQEDRVKELAAKLGVAAWTLDTLRVGYGELAGTWCWAFPERNHLGQVIGINRRLPDGSKRCAPGSRRGLTYCDEWLDFPGPVVIVEGGSDVAALLTLHVCAIGRPSNTGGVEYLAKRLRGVQRDILVLGERDRKKHEGEPKCQGCALCAPGLYGAKVVSAKLTKRLGRRVRWLLTPDRDKDPRAWLNARMPHPEDEFARAYYSRVFLGKIGVRQ